MLTTSPAIDDLTSDSPHLVKGAASQQTWLARGKIPYLEVIFPARNLSLVGILTAPSLMLVILC